MAVSSGDWVSQFDAADELGVSTWRVGALISNGHLQPAEDPAGLAGVSRASLKEEVRWRSEATSWARAVRRLKDVLRWF